VASNLAHIVPYWDPRIFLLKVSHDPRMELHPTRTHTCCTSHRADDHAIADVNEDHDKLVQLYHEYGLHQVHEVSGGVGQPKRHHQILIETVSSGESSLWNIFFTDLNLAIT
jgi:hypothetical protein